MGEREYERRLASLKKELTDLSHKMDRVPIDSQEWQAANERQTQLARELAALDDEFSRRHRQ